MSLAFSFVFFALVVSIVPSTGLFRDKYSSGPSSFSSGFSCICENGGTCVDSQGSCVCVNGWTGPTCSINIDDCAAASCLNGGTCHDKVGSFYCECPPGKTGLLCHLEDACASNPCQYGAVCDTSPVDGSYTCNCPKGFTGMDCSQDIDECRSNSTSVISVRHPWSQSYKHHDIDGPCEHGGTCINTIGSFKCNCEAGFTGPRCEININECESAPCLNDGTCLDNPGFFTCVCMPGFTGTRCDIELDECSSKPCQNGGICNDLINAYKCMCPPGITGINCETNIDDCASNPCQNEAECKDSLDSYICKCRPGFNGPQCETNIDECANKPCIHGFCIDGINGFTCKCPIGYDGKLCQNTVNDCLSSPCMFGGTCVDLYASNRSNSLPVRYDHTANSRIWNSRSQNNYNQRAQLWGHEEGNNGNNAKGYKCICPPGTTGPRCEQNINDCWSNPCLNNATCTDLINGYRCNCPPGFTGPTCSLDIDECTFSDNVCMNGATCINLTPGFKCICPSGYYGKTCTYDQDDCLSSPCLNDGQCRDHPGRGHYSCICPASFTGQRCESRLESASSCTLNPCAHGATCIPSHGDDFKCACRPGYTGERCEVNINECEVNPCTNGGTCLDGINGFTCLCALPFSGRRCDMSLDPCLFNQCSGRSKCIPSQDLTNYTCLCEPGMKGKFCGDDVDECASGYIPGFSYRHRNRNEKEILCLNGGQCMNTIGSYRCNCARGFSGDRCEINVNECVSETDSGPICLNGGTCLDLDAKYQCLCRQGWTGPNCQVAVKACSSSPCKNGATCLDSRNSSSSSSSSYQCSCQLGFSGRNCETNDNDCSSSSCLNGGTCIDGINSVTCHCPDGFSGTNCQDRVDKNVNYGYKRLVCRGFDIDAIQASSHHNYFSESSNYDHVARCETVDPWSKCPEAEFCALRFGNRICDPICNSRECFFDGNDCESGSDDEQQCNELYDNYCLANYANGFCDQGCNTKACNYDGLDCIDNKTLVARTLPGTINITIDTPLGTIERIGRRALTAFIRELSTLIPGSTFELKSKARDETTGFAVLELEVNEATCQQDCFNKVSEVAGYMAALQQSTSIFSQPLPGSSLRITSVKAVEEEESGGFPSGPQSSLSVILSAACILFLIGGLIGVLYQTNGGGPMKSKKARGIVWFPEGFPASVRGSRRDIGSARAAGGDYTQRPRGYDGQEMHSLSANIKGEIGQNHTLLRRKGDKDSMDTLEESIYDEPNEPRPWTIQHYEAFQGRSAISDYGTTGQLMSPPLYGQYPGSPPGVGVDVRGPGGLTPLMVASAFDSQNLFCQQKMLSASNLFPGSPSTLLRQQTELDGNNQVSSPTQRHAFSPGEFNANNLDTVSSDVITELINSGACLSKQSETAGETPLHLAARYSRADAAKRLLDAGADCNAVDFAGRTPLHSAIAADARGVFEILLRNRATNLEAQAYDGSTPLILAARLACEGMLEDLVVALNQPGSLDAQDEAGRTALHWAASVNNVKGVEILINAGANRDAQDNREETPLFLACREGAKEAARTLLEQGANRDITDHMDKQPRDVAAERFHNDIVQLLDEVQPIVMNHGSHLMNNVSSPQNTLQHHQPQPPIMMMSLPRKRRGSTSANDGHHGSSSTQHLLQAESSSTMSSPPPTPSKPNPGNNVLSGNNNVVHSRSQSTASAAAPKKRSASSRRASSAARGQQHQQMVTNNGHQMQQQPQMLMMGQQSNVPGGQLVPLLPLSPHLINSSSATNYNPQVAPLITTATSSAISNSNNIYTTTQLLLSPPSSSSPMSSSFSPSSHHTLSPPSHHHGQHMQPQQQHQVTYSHYQPSLNSFMNQGHHQHVNHNQSSSIPPPAYDEIQSNGNGIYNEINSFYSALQPLYSQSMNHHHDPSPFSYEANDNLAYLTPSPDSPENGVIYSPDPASNNRITDWTNVDANPGSNHSCSSSSSSNPANNSNGNGHQTMSNKNHISSNPAPSQQSVFI